MRSDVVCVYDDRRTKPGLRAGAVDQLYRRVETLENMFLGQEMLWQQMWQSLFPNTEPPRCLAKGTTAATTLAERREQLKSSVLDSAKLATKRSSTEANTDDSAPPECAPPQAKRTRVENELVYHAVALEFESRVASPLPDAVLTELVDFYFTNIHPWIPILHVKKFRERMRSPEERVHINCILHAIVSVCARFSQNKQYDDTLDMKEIAKKSRQEVILQSTETFSVENLQAQVIVAFETINRGRGPSSWSIIGSMAGTVEQLQLGVEEDDLYRVKGMEERLIRRMVFLTPSRSWSEAEERRRVFWAVFLMDRFCSVSTGWKISLRNADVKRRLPCEGALWEKEQDVCTPYFGISDIRNTSLSNSHSATIDGREEQAIGAFAYIIEATESLALVTNFYLHHAFLINDASKARLWLVKFKELDLRLIRWKIHLPPKWREACVLNEQRVMDPNLTLAHITHNTAVILLHQGIAYPPAHWQKCPIRLPSASSADTCLEAASEIATIADQFLSFSPIFTNPQFSFCLFIAGRTLLAHARHNRVPPSPALNTLIANLMEISQRWTRQHDGSQAHQEDSLAFKFATRLTEAQQNRACVSRPSLDIRTTAYSDESKEEMYKDLVGTKPDDPPEYESLGEPLQLAPFPSQQTTGCSFDPFSLAFPPLPPAFQQGFSPTGLDPFSFYNMQLPSDPSISSPLEARSHESGSRHDSESSMTSLMPTDISHLFDVTSSPGQRISYYGNTRDLTKDSVTDGIEN
ncbi:C6 transcription factor [Aspergillus luchuensis IFO 4308]|nr:C6 transcription factor [Aspergillus luchuensis IFO 4308]